MKSQVIIRFKLCQFLWYIWQVRTVPQLQTFLILSLISLLLFGLDTIHFLGFIKTGVSFITNPISYGFYKSNQQIGNQLYFLVSARTAAKTNKALEEQLGLLLAENASLRTKLAESDAQLAQQSSVSPRTYNLVTARPIGLDRYLLIDKGSSDGIKVNEAAIFKDNYIGQIIRVTEKSAAVKLSTDPDSKLSAFSSGQSGKAKGVLLGQFGKDLLFDKVLHQEPLEIGNLLYSEGVETFLPRGLILGKVTEVLENGSQVFKQAKVSPEFNVGDLDLIFVITE